MAGYFRLAKGESNPSRALSRSAPSPSHKTKKAKSSSSNPFPSTSNQPVPQGSAHTSSLPTPVNRAICSHSQSAAPSISSPNYKTHLAPLSKPLAARSGKQVWKPIVKTPQTPVDTLLPHPSASPSTSPPLPSTSRTLS